MATVTKTFAFLSDTEGYVAVPSSSNIEMAWDATGNPSGSLRAFTSAKGQGATLNYWQYEGTWESLGVPSGATVTAIRLLSASTRCVSRSSHAQTTIIGPYEVRDTSESLIGTLWAGRTATSAEATWTATGAQSSISVPSGQQPSNSTIRIRLSDTIATGGGGGTPSVALHDDQVSLEVTYTPLVTATPKSASDSGTLSTTSTSGVVPVTPPAGISSPWVGTPTMGNVSGASATSATVDVSGATNGEVCFIFGYLTDAQTTDITHGSWNILSQTTEGTSGGSSSRQIILWKVKSSGDTTVTINWSVSTKFQFVPISWPGVHGTGPTEGLSWLTHTSGTSYVTGTATPTDTNRWAVGIFGARGSTAVVPWTFDAALTERVNVTNTNSPFDGFGVADSGAPVTAASHTYTSTGQSASHGISGLLYLVPGSSTPPPTPDVFVTASDSGTLSSTDSGSATPVVITLPGHIGGVEPESHAHNPPLLAPNGNLYRITESDTASGNHPMAWKSSDGGSTWVEMDSANRPTAQDMEGSWVAMDGTTLIFTVTRDDTVWWTTFNTTTDTWASQETIDTGLSSSGVEQYSSFVKNGDGTFWVFYSDTLSGTNQQIAYRKRTAANTYSAKLPIGPTTSSNIAPSPIKGASDLTHIFYKDDTANTIYWRTLTTAGVLSAATSVATGTATDNIPHTNAVYYDDAGTEHVFLSYADSSDMLRLIHIAGGVQQTTEAISTSPITMDPGSVTNGGTVAHLAVYGTTVYAVWGDASTGDVFMRSRAANGTWSTVSTLWNSGANAAWYIFNNIYVRGSDIVMGYVYDVTHDIDVSDLWYNEISLGTTSTTTNVSASDSGTLSATEGRTFGPIVFSSGDSGSLSVIESRSFGTVALASSDTGTLSATESRSFGTSSISVSDTGVLSVTESTSFGIVSISGVDAGNVSVVELRSFGTVGVSASEVGSLSVSESTTFGVTPISASDSVSLSVSESRVIAASSSSTDSGIISVNELAGLFKTVIATDSGSLSAVETATVFNDRPGSDSGSISIVDAGSVQVSGSISKSAVDSGSISVTDQSQASIAVVANDSGSLSVVDSSTSSLTSASADVGSISVIDSKTLASSSAGNDNGLISVTETTALAVVTNASDSGSISVSESKSLVSASTSSDDGSLSIVDSAGIFKTVSASDAGSLSAVDGSSVFNNRPGSDAGTLSATETSSLQVGGVVSYGASDAGSISTNDQAQSLKVFITATDTGALSVMESRTSSGTVSRSDSGALSVLETSMVVKSIASSDSGALSVSESWTKDVIVGTPVEAWDGTKFVASTMKRWNGSTMVDITALRWDGTGWV
jgi:hypothetical protein